MQQDATMSVHSLELVVQLGNVRSDDDPIHLVTCNYELGVKHESDSKGASDGLVCVCLYCTPGDGSSWTNFHPNVYNWG